MPHALRVCPTPGCPELTTGGRCDAHTQAAEHHRGPARSRGYGRQHERRFRPAVLRRDPLCVCTGGCCPNHQHGPPSCLAPSTVADHWPRSRRELATAGGDPNDPANGRGLCAPCHNHHTAHAQPGGWNTR
jgi:5-methylcytosine-specific restriction protein A